MEELRNTVEIINDAIFMTEAWDHIEYPPFLEFISSPIGHRVTFCGFCIWDSENDMRVYFDEEDEYEPFKNYLLREVGNILLAINTAHNVIKKASV